MGGRGRFLHGEGCPGPSVDISGSPARCRRRGRAGLWVTFSLVSSFSIPTDSQSRGMVLIGQNPRADHRRDRLDECRAHERY